MAPRDCTSDQSSSPSNTYRRSLVPVDDEHDDCCGQSGSSLETLEDTLSITCDESVTSSTSSSSLSEDNTIQVDDEIDIYESPHLLRRRLLPLAPSPITEFGLDSPIQRRKFENKSSWKWRPSIRILFFTLGLAWIAYLLVMSVDYRWLRDMRETLEDGGLSEEVREWRRFLRRRAPKILQKLPSKSANPKYTIRIRGHRLDLVTQSLDFHASCPSVKDVQVEWTDSNAKQPPSLLAHKSGKVKPTGKPSTPAVFLLDEDIILSCQEIETAFQEWRLDPSRLVGFYPFNHSEEKLYDSSGSKFRLRPVSRGSSYSMLSDRAVFIHSLLFRNIPSAPRECQQLGMSVIVSSITSKPPVAVLSKPQTFQPSSKRKNKELPESVSQACQHWIESIGLKDLPDQIASIAGHQDRYNTMS